MMEKLFQEDAYINCFLFHKHGKINEVNLYETALFDKG